MASSMAKHDQNETDGPVNMPLQMDVINSTVNEFEQLKHALETIFNLNRDLLRKQATFAQNIAFRVLGSIDWTCANFNEIEELFKPVINKTNGHCITKEQGKFVKLNENEVKRGIHEWTLWRIKFNNHLIENNFINTKCKFDNEDKIKENVYLYMIAKWANDNSNLDLGTYVHYGIPRARLRSTSTTHSKSQSCEQYDVDSSRSTSSSGCISTTSSFDLSNNELTNVTEPSTIKPNRPKSKLSYFSRFKKESDVNMNLTKIDSTSPKLSSYFDGKVRVDSNNNNK